MTRRAIFLLTLLFFTDYCGNPALTRSISPSETRAEKNKKSSIFDIFGTPKGNKVTETVFENDEIQIKIKFMNTVDLGWYISRQVIKEEDIIRLPGMTYIEYTVVNKSEKSRSINLYNLAFTDEWNNKYQPVTQAEYKKRYTSAAYSFINYNTFFSPYETSKNSEKEKDDKKNKTSIETNWEAPGNSTWRQVVPFDRLSERSRTYLLEGNISNDIKINLKFYLHIHRSDKQ